MSYVSYPYSYMPYGPMYAPGVGQSYTVKQSTSESKGAGVNAGTFAGYPSYGYGMPYYGGYPISTVQAPIATRDITPPVTLAAPLPYYIMPYQVSHGCR